MDPDGRFGCAGSHIPSICEAGGFSGTSGPMKAVPGKGERASEPKVSGADGGVDIRDLLNRLGLCCGDLTKNGNIFDVDVLDALYDDLVPFLLGC